MESCECEFADVTDAEQLATAEWGGSTPAMAKADRLAAHCLQKKRRRAKKTTEDCAARLQSYHSFLHNSFACEACLMCYAYA